MSEPVVELTGVTVSFGAGTAEARRVLDDLDLTVQRGEIVAVAGRSGSGKTTLLTLVTGLEAPDAGTISVLGRSDRLDELRWSDVALLPQSLGLLDELTIVENIALPLRLGTEQPGDDVAEHKARLGVYHQAAPSPDAVSLGEQQRTPLTRPSGVRRRCAAPDTPTRPHTHPRAAARRH